MIRTVVMLPKAMRTKIDKISKETGAPMAEVIRRLLQKSLSN